MNTFTQSDLEILRSIQLSELPTRQSVSKDVRLSLLKVSKVLKDLEVKGIIRKAGKSYSSSGRPSYIYEIRPDYLYTMGASISNTGMIIIATDATKEIIMSDEISFSLEARYAHGSESLLDEIITPLKRIQTTLAQQGMSPSSIGISVPGMIDTAQHIWLSGLQLPGIDHVDVNSEICRRMDIPVFAEDNSRIMAYYEKVWGAGKDLSNFVSLYLGIGVGAGIIIDNKIYRGAHGTTGEIGHIIHSGNKYRCSCGNVGCLETVTSHSGILRVFKDRLSEGVHSPLQVINQSDAGLTLQDILEAAEDGDKLARTTLFEIGQFIGDACNILINLFNPEKLFITGTVSLFKEYLEDAINLSLSRRVFPSILEQTVIEFTPYSWIKEAHGAGLFALSQYWDALVASNGNGVRMECD